jgi:hypothetical protein
MGPARIRQDKSRVRWKKPYPRLDFLIESHSLQLTCDALKTGRKVVWVGQLPHLIVHFPSSRRAPGPDILRCLPIPTAHHRNDLTKRANRCV